MVVITAQRELVRLWRLHTVVADSISIARFFSPVFLSRIRWKPMLEFSFTRNDRFAVSDLFFLIFFFSTRDSERQKKGRGKLDRD